MEPMKPIKTVFIDEYFFDPSQYPKGILIPNPPRLQFRDFQIFLEIKKEFLSTTHID